MTIEERISALEKRINALEKENLANVRLGPQPEDSDKRIQEVKRIADALKEKFNKPEPIDYSARVLVSGKPVIDDEHKEINPDTGMQKDYVVLSADERHKGYVRPYRDAYKHLVCGKITTMARSIAETYARAPEFYSGTFCHACKGHFPIGEDGEFVWYEMDGSIGPKVGL